jgi:hypothetical protein
MRFVRALGEVEEEALERTLCYSLKLPHLLPRPAPDDHNSAGRVDR